MITIKRNDNMTTLRILSSTILSLLACFTLITNAYGKEPKAVISEKDYHFGKVWQGDAVKHIFRLKNAGNEDLIIRKPEITGSFTRVILHRTVPQGQEMEITLDMDTNKILGDVETGVILYTNDPANPRIELKMRGRVIPVIDVRPMAALFFSVYEGQTKEGAVNIINNYDHPLKITGIESRSSRFTAHLQTIKEGQEYKLFIKVNPKAIPGRTMEQVTLSTNNAKMPEVIVGVNIFIKRDVYIFPDQVDFGAIDLEKVKKNPQLLDFLIQTALVKRREGKGKDFQIKLEHNIPFINIKKEPESGSETYRLDISLVPEKMIPGKVETFIRVLTNDKEAPELKIPVRGMFN